MMNEPEQFQLRNLQVNPFNHTSLVSLPSSYVRYLKLSKGDRMKISLVKDGEENSKLVISKARVS